MSVSRISFAWPLCAAWMVFAGGPATAQETPVTAGWDPHVLLEGFAGTDTGGDARALIPFWQDPAHIAFLYPYYVYANDGDYQAAGIGVGARSQVSAEWLLGVYGFADWTRQYDTWWTQASVGVEALSPDWDLRLNGYIPYGDGGDATAGAAYAVLNEANYLEILLNKRIDMYGVDGEVGYRLFNWGDNDGDNELRVFGGGYTWWRDGVETVTGVSGRIEARVNDLAGFPPGSRLTVGGYGTYDNVDGAQGAFMVGLRLPLGMPGTTTRHTGLAARMDEDINRRWGARIGGTYEELPAYFVFDDETEMRETGQVYFIDGDQDVDKSGLSPEQATALDEAINRAGENGIIVALDQYEKIFTPGSQLLYGQAIIGGGSLFPVMTASGEMAYYMAWRPAGRGPSPSIGRMTTVARRRSRRRPLRSIDNLS